MPAPQAIGAEGGQAAASTRRDQPPLKGHVAACATAAAAATIRIEFARVGARRKPRCRLRSLKHAKSAAETARGRAETRPDGSHGLDIVKLLIWSLEVELEENVLSSSTSLCPPSPLTFQLAVSRSWL